MSAVFQLHYFEALRTGVLRFEFQAQSEQQAQAHALALLNFSSQLAAIPSANAHAAEGPGTTQPGPSVGEDDVEQARRLAG